MNHPRSFYSSRPTQSYHFQADLNWCDGTFKKSTAMCKVHNVGLRFIKYSLQLQVLYYLLVLSTGSHIHFLKMNKGEKGYTLIYIYVRFIKLTLSALGSEMYILNLTIDVTSKSSKISKDYYVKTVSFGHSSEYTTGRT